MNTRLSAKKAHGEERKWRKQQCTMIQRDKHTLFLRRSFLETIPCDVVGIVITTLAPHSFFGREGRDELHFQYPLPPNDFFIQIFPEVNFPREWNQPQVRKMFPWKPQQAVFRGIRFFLTREGKPIRFFFKSAGSSRHPLCVLSRTVTNSWERTTKLKGKWNFKRPHRRQLWVYTYYSVRPPKVFFAPSMDNRHDEKKGKKHKKSFHLFMKYSFHQYVKDTFTTWNRWCPRTVWVSLLHES